MIKKFFVLLVTAYSFSTGLLQAKTYDFLLAAINQEAISQKGFEYALSMEYLQRALKKPTTSQQEFLQVTTARKIFEEALLNSEARILSIPVSEEEIELELENYKKNRHFSQQDLENFLRYNQLTLIAFKISLRSQIQRNALVQRYVSSRISLQSDKIKEYYNQTYTKPQRVVIGRNYMIAFPDPSKVSADLLIAKEKELATYVPLTKSGAKGLQEINRIFQTKQAYSVQAFELEENSLSDNFKAAVEKTPKGQFTPVVSSPRGVHLLLIEGFKMAPPSPLDQIQERVRDEYYRSEFNKFYAIYIQELEKKSQVVFHDKAFSALLQKYSNNPSAYLQ